MTVDRGDDRAIAWVCFECAIVTIELDGQVVGGSHIDYIEYDLLLAALAIFPGDEKLAGLRNEFRKRHERRLAFGERQELGASRPATMDDVMRGFGGEATLAALRHPERVEAALLKRPEPLRYVPANEYQDAGEPVTVPVDVTGEILVRLLAPESYTINLDGSAKGCFPVYGVRMTFFGGGSKVDLYFCLGCAHLAIYAQGVAIGGLDIGSICKPLAQEFAKLFPDNAELAGLAGVAGQFPRENARGGLPTFAPAP
jgi:hypothetical protein